MLLCHYVVKYITLNNITGAESKLYCFTLWNNKNMCVYCITYSKEVKAKIS